MCYWFLWVGSQDDYVLPWVRWDRIGVPKVWGGWGIKDLHLFAKALAGKVGWRSMTTNNIYTLVVYKKHIFPSSVDDWVRFPNKKKANVSIIWKEVISSFSMVEIGLAWKVGNGRNMRVGIDPWVGGGEIFHLPRDLVTLLNENGSI